MTQMNASILVQLRDRLTAPAKVMTGAVQRMNKVGRGIKDWARDATQRFEAMEERLARLGQMTFVFDQMNQAGRSMLGFLKAPISAAMSLEDAMAEVAKVVDFDSPDGLKNLQKELLELSRIPGMPSVSELAQIAAAGGQGGIPTDELVAFTAAAAQMGTSFDVSARDGGDALAKWRDWFGLTNEQAMNLGGAINELGNNTNAKAKNIVDVLTRIGVTGRDIGLSAEQTAALGAAMVAAGAQSEVAGTSLNSFMQRLSMGAEGSPQFSSGLKRLGLDGKVFAEDLRRNPEAAITRFLALVEESSDKQLILKEMFGLEHAANIGRLAGALDGYTAAQALASNKTMTMTSLQIEFEKASERSSAKIRAMQQSISAFIARVGGPFLDTVGGMADTVNRLFGWLSQLAEMFPVVSTVVLSVIGIFGALLSVLGTVGSAMITAAGFVSLLNWSLITLRLTFLKTALAFMFSPWGLVIAAIAAGAYLIIKNWDKISAFFGKLWARLVAGVKAAFNWFMKLAGFSPLGMIIKHWQPITSWFSKLFEGVSNGIKTAMDKAVGWILNPIGKLKNLLGLAKRAMNDFSDDDAAHMARGAKVAFDLYRQGRLPGVPLAGIDEGSGLAPGEVNERGRGNVTYRDESTMTIVQQPGESQTDFAARLQDERERRQRKMMADVL